jgi:NAD-dependent deacetylase
MILTDVAEAGRALAEAFSAARRAVVFTGAGISTESGIPDFRSPGGIWSRMQPVTFEEFLASEEARLEDWRRRFGMVRLIAGCEPNAAHRAVGRLAGDGGCVAMVITQNIDGLHTRAGVPPARLVELHGTTDHAACLDCGERMEIAEAELVVDTEGRAPRCRACGGLVKAAVISFGQMMPEEEMQRAMEASVEADLFVAAGSSLVVYPAAAFPQIAREAGARLIIANREPTDQDGTADLVLRTPLAETFSAMEHMKFH